MDDFTSLKETDGGFKNDKVINIHTGAFGLNYARSLYGTQKTQVSCLSSDPSFRPKPVLCDLDREEMDRI